MIFKKKSSSVFRSGLYRSSEMIRELELIKVLKQIGVTLIDWETQFEIGEMIGASRRTVIKYLKSLVSIGLLQEIKGRPITFRILMDLEDGNDLYIC